MKRGGVFVQQARGAHGYKAFIPAPLPPRPAIRFDPGLTQVYEAAVLAVGRLAGISESIAPDRMLYMYVRKEAVLSSAIEGTQSTLTDLLEYENAMVRGTPLDDVEEVSRYVAALTHGIHLIQSGELPMSLRLIRELHRILMTGGRGGSSAPGEFRQSQNWLGGSAPWNARFVPPPPQEMKKALSNFERFIHDSDHVTPPLIKAGLAHAQFETIHPFLDGNGRVGRLLINLLLVVDGVLPRPYFYLSLYLRQNRADYYDALQRIRTHGDWEGWLRFYLIGVESVATEAAQTTTALRDLFETDQARIAAIGRAAPSVLRVYDVLRDRIVVTPTKARDMLDMTFPTVTSALNRLVDLGVAREITGRQRNRVYVYDRQLEILDHGIGN